MSSPSVDFTVTITTDAWALSRTWRHICLSWSWTEALNTPAKSLTQSVGLREATGRPKPRKTAGGRPTRGKDGKAVASGKIVQESESVTSELRPVGGFSWLAALACRNDKVRGTFLQLRSGLALASAGDTPALHATQELDHLALGPV